MPGILPDTGNGGLVIRTADGTCAIPDTVANAFCPPATFTSTCELTALPSTCDARLSAAQVNAIVSELLCFASTLNPTGNWDCAAVCNLATNFEAWEQTIPAQAVAGICATQELTDALATCLTSTDTDNLLGPGADGRIALTADDVAAGICTDDSAGDTLAACLISADAGNTMKQGADGRLFASERYSAAAAPPAAPAVGDHWNNTSAGTVSGVPSGITARWNGTIWEIPAGTVARYGNWTIAQNLASGVQTILLGTAYTQVAADLGTSTFTGGVFTVGPGEGGLYLFEAQASSANANVEVAVTGVTVANNVAVSGIATNGNTSMQVATLIRLVPGDTFRVQLRQIAPAGASQNMTGTFRLARLSL